jgi:hypothetical protein
MVSQSFAMEQKGSYEEGADEHQPELILPELWEKVFKHLPHYGLKDLSLVSRRMHEITLTEPRYGMVPQSSPRGALLLKEVLGFLRCNVLSRLASIGALLEIQSIQENCQPSQIERALHNACDENHLDIVQFLLTERPVTLEMLCDSHITWKEDILRMVVHFFKPEWFPDLLSPLTIADYEKPCQVILLAEVMNSPSIQQQYFMAYPEVFFLLKLPTLREELQKLPATFMEDSDSFRGRFVFALSCKYVAQCFKGDFGEEVKDNCLREWILLLHDCWQPTQGSATLCFDLCHIAIHYEVVEFVQFVVNQHQWTKDFVIESFFNKAVKGNRQEILASLKNVPFQTSIGDALVNGNIYLFKKYLENCSDPGVVTILADFKGIEAYDEFTEEKSWTIWVSVLVPQINENPKLLEDCVEQFVRANKPEDFKRLLQTLKPEAREGDWNEGYYRILSTECFIHDRPFFLGFFFPGEQQIVEMKPPLTRCTMKREIKRAKQYGAIECNAFLKTILASNFP